MEENAEAVEQPNEEEMSQADRLTRAHKMHVYTQKILKLEKHAYKTNTYKSGEMIREIRNIIEEK